MVFNLTAEDASVITYAGELEVRPPCAPTAENCSDVLTGRPDGVQRIGSMQTADFQPEGAQGGEDESEVKCSTNSARSAALTVAPHPTILSMTRVHPSAVKRC